MWRYIAIMPPATVTLILLALLHKIGTSTACITVETDSYQICYRFTTKMRPWYNTLSKCAIQLVKFENQEQFDDFVQFVMPYAPQDRFWIGASRADTSSAFRWTDNSTLDFTKWASGKTPFSGNCVVMDRSISGLWVGEECSSYLNVACVKEYVPITTSITTAAAEVSTTTNATETTAASSSASSTTELLSFTTSSESTSSDTITSVANTGETTSSGSSAPIFGDTSVELSSSTLSPSTPTTTKHMTSTIKTPMTSSSTPSTPVPSPDTLCPIISLNDFTVADIADRKVNSAAVLACVPGHSFPDGTFIRSFVCLGNGKWSSEIQLCQPIRCPALAAVANVTSDAENKIMFYEDQKITFTCKPGMRMRDGSEAKTVHCTSSGWTDSVSDCTVEMCAPVPLIMKARVMPLNAQVGSTVHVSCENGYVFQGNNTRLALTCPQNKAWTPKLPDCSLVTCPALTAPTNATLNTTKQSYDTVVKVQCDTGFVFPDNTTSIIVRCQKDRNWSSNIKECKIITCPPPPVIANAVTSGSGRSFGTKIRYACDTGYRLNDGTRRKEITCTENFLWSEEKLNCRDDRCPPVQDVTNAVIDTTDTDRFIRVTFTCGPGHRFIGEDKISKQVMCMVNLIWDTVLPGCEVLLCPKPPPIKHGIVNSQEPSPFSSLVNYTCNPGYTFPDNSSSAVLKCSDDGPGKVVWMPQVNNCQPRVCPSLPEIVNATKSTEDTVYNTVVKFECPRGFEFNSKQRVAHVRCTEDGSWDHSVTQCIPAFCPEIPVWNEAIFNSTSREHLSVIMYSCPPELKFADGSQYKVTFCNDDMVWEPSLQACEPITGIGDDIKKNKVEAAGSTSIGTVSVIIIGIICVFIFLLDVFNLFSHMQKASQNIKNFIEISGQFYHKFCTKTNVVHPQKECC